MEKTVRLQGCERPISRSAIKETMNWLRGLSVEDYDTFSTLVRKSRLPDYEIPAPKRDKLERYKLLARDGTVAPVAKAIVLSAVRLEGTRFVLYEPELIH